ncbi:hypothetical protein ABLE68_09045 [Nocardioides sp. CN2-186]
MSDNNMTSGLLQTWVPVIDSQGRTHLEAQWTDGPAPTPVHITHAA